MSVAPDDDATAHADTGSAAAVADNPPLKFGAAVTETPARDEVFEPRRLSSGRHGTSIAMVVVSGDGAGVVSLDVEAHARLWPALDGSREPLALPLISPSEIAIHHDTDGFAIAALDTAGGIAILDIDNTDMLVNQVALAAEPAYSHVLATGTGFIALRKDHQLDWIDRAGVRGAALLPPQGQRIAGLFAAAGRVLALVETREGIHGQWLEASSTKLAWGDTTPMLDLDPERTFLSPDATRLAAMRTKRKGPAVFELATGAAKSLKQRDPAAPPRFELEVPQARVDPFTIDPPGKLLGWATNDRVVFSDLFEGGGPFAWYDLRGKLVAQMSDDLAFMFASEQTAFGGGKVVSFMDRELAVVTPTRVDYLGYRTRTARGLRATRAGVVATLGGTRMLDERLRIGTSFDDRLRVADDLALVPVAARNTIDESWLETPSPRPRNPTTRIALLDLTTKREQQTWPVTSIGRRVRFEPATELMAIDHGKKLELATFDPVKRAFGPATTIEVPTTNDVVLLDPAVAGGLVAITVHKAEIRRWRAEDIRAGVAPAPTALTSAPEAIDRAGHVYVRENADTILITGGTADVRIHELTGWKIRPNADGTRIAVLGTNGAMLLDGQGKTLWTIGMPGLANLVWSDDGKLLAQARDLVELSVADGSIVFAQCGWTFGKRTQPVQDFIPTDQTYCDR